MGRILIIDDNQAFLDHLATYINENYPRLEVETCRDPFQGLVALRREAPELLLVDLEMPALDGAKVFRYATEAGMDKNRIVIISGRESDYLHEHFPLGTCLAVLNKYEVRQKAVLDMIFSSLERKAGD
jgi:DNA-binding response OmpR family regulator